MKIGFDEAAWQRLQDGLSVGQVCGDTAGRLLAFAKAAMQQASASLAGEGDATPEDAAHTLEMLRAVRNATADAAQRYAVAVAQLDDLMRPLDAGPPRPRRRVAVG